MAFTATVSKQSVAKIEHPDGNRFRITLLLEVKNDLNAVVHSASFSEIVRLNIDPFAMFARRPRLLVSVPSGGTSYTRQIDDTIGITDAQASLSTFIRGFTESIGTSDSSGSASGAIRSQSEAISLADDNTKVHDAIRAISDSVGLLDIDDSVYVGTRDIADTVGLKDAMSCM